MKYNTTQFTVKKVEGKTGIQVDLVKTFDFNGKENEVVAAGHYFTEEELTDEIEHELRTKIDIAVKNFIK